MPFTRLTQASLVPGKTVPYILDNLPGSPIVHLEHLGDENETWLSEVVTKAGDAAKRMAKSPKSAKGKDARTMLREARAEDRRILVAHIIRKLEAFHDDGRAATDEDIPEFVAALPDDVVRDLVRFANFAENFRERVVELADPKALAEK